MSRHEVSPLHSLNWIKSINGLRTVSMPTKIRSRAMMQASFSSFSAFNTRSSSDGSSIVLPTELLFFILSVASWMYLEQILRKEFLSVKIYYNYSPFFLSLDKEVHVVHVFGPDRCWEVSPEGHLQFEYSHIPQSMFRSIDQLLGLRVL